ncbi:hypothetical protein CLV72_104675 [Allonocardiopsis opalescens]|uniref:Uncharacterized protein n=1 Tax=Allonocardiopsis opalescens TaxID=1144618 RepID=A0A2T0Q5L3_9ACTN|nr:hypothetical protein CLV72_104675 [Allonocardiopsis opalescens]
MPRSAAEIHAYFVALLNSALRRPGMFGGEVELTMLTRHLLFVEGRDGAWEDWEAEQTWRGAFNTCRATGGFGRLLPGDSMDCAAASLYAEFAQAQRWLRPDRVLGPAEYASMRAGLREWTTRDRVLGDVLTAFGPPSLRCGGANPRYGKTLCYLTGRREDPLVAFHLWNGSERGAGAVWPPPYDEPALLAARTGSGPFAATFAFTPEGRRHRPEPPGGC